MSNGNVPDATTNPIMASDATLRDMFAGQALIAEINTYPEETIESAAKELGIDYNSYNAKNDYPKVIAMRCYRYADAMLKARSNGKT